MKAQLVTFSYPSLPRRDFFYLRVAVSSSGLICRRRCSSVIVR